MLWRICIANPVFMNKLEYIKTSILRTKHCFKQLFKYFYLRSDTSSIEIGPLLSPGDNRVSLLQKNEVNLEERMLSCIQYIMVFFPLKVEISLLAVPELNFDDTLSEIAMNFEMDADGSQRSLLINAQRRHTWNIQSSSVVS